MNKGKIFVISGPSGVGKGTIVDKIIKNCMLNLCWAKSYTTRPERKSDNGENHYIFVDYKKFKTLEKTGEILESNFYNGYFYGSSKSEINKALSTGKNILKEVDVNGGMVYRKSYPEAILIFIKADLADIKNRLKKRMQNTFEEIEERTSIAKKEMEFEKKYDYSIENTEGKPEKAIKKVEDIIAAKIKI